MFLKRLTHQINYSWATFCCMISLCYDIKRQTQIKILKKSTIVKLRQLVFAPS